jgi:hypothetical protein
MPDSTLSGSCLCGAVSYTVTGEERFFYHCHCQRCRKATGTGHASNLFVHGTVCFDSGEEQVQTYKLPDAKRFGNSFCRRCGARVPVFIDEFGLCMIPAGSLDDEPSIRPEARIFVGSRAEWSCSGERIPSFDEYKR